MTREPFSIAAIQATPLVLDREATVEKACALIVEAAAGGAKLAVFPETFIPTYPAWVRYAAPGDDVSVRLYTQLLAQSVDVPGPSVDRLCEAAGNAGIYVVMGVNERNVEASGASLYNTLLYISDQGEFLGKHRKLVPTLGERLVWAPGAGDTLQSYDTPFGKLGGLICYENYMPLARYTLYAAGVEIYVAPTWARGDGWLATLKHIALEGRTHVIGCCMPMRVSDLPDGLGLRELFEGPERWINPGNSTIVGPKGDILAGPLSKEEGILYATIDPETASAAKYIFDVAGHYARPDVFELTVHTSPHPIVVREGAKDVEKS